MIYELRNKRPTITFGLGKTSLVLDSPKEVTIWIQTLNVAKLEPSFTKESKLDADWVKQDGNQKLIIDCRSQGEWEIQIQYPNGLKSNILHLTVN